MDNALVKQWQENNAQVLERELYGLNEESQHYGLTLSHEGAQALCQGREAALVDTGRMELGPGVLPKIVRALLDSPYLVQRNYEETLYAFQNLFYTVKGELFENYSDDALIQIMVTAFNGQCGGDLAALSGYLEETRCHKE